MREPRLIGGEWGFPAVTCNETATYCQSPEPTGRAEMHHDRFICCHIDRRRQSADSRLLGTPTSVSGLPSAPRHAPQQKQVEVEEIGVGRPGDHEGAETGEDRVRVVVREPGRRVNALRARA